MKNLLRYGGRALAGLVAVAALLTVFVYAASAHKLGQRYDVPAVDLALTADSALVAHGAHLASIRGCTECHGGDLGGRVMIDDPALGRIVATNLTAGRGGIGGRYRTGADWDRAVRHGVAPDGRALLLMPSHEFAPMSDDDVAAVAAYARALPPVDRDLPASRVGPLGRALYLAGKIPLVPAEHIDHAAPRTTAPPAGPTAAYGEYLATTCTGCHGSGLVGGPMHGGPPGGPLAANLTPDPETGLAAWGEDDFRRALREGVAPDGRALSPAMPVSMTKHFTDTEIAALWAYLRTLPPTHTPGA